jgi:pimeloyl-ACP methyl ester carboxylesterase
MERSATSVSRHLSTARRSSQAKRLYVTVNGTRVRYIEAGHSNQGTPLLMLHGYNGSADFFYPHTLPGLAEERHVLAPDLPGCGYSGSWRSYSLDAYVEFVTAFLDAKGIAQADLFGHSMGGQLAIAAAAAHPHRFRRLVLVDSAGLPELVKRQLLVPFKMMTDACLRHVRMYPSFIRTGLKARAPFQGLRILRQSGVGTLLEALPMPTLIVWGSHDHVVPIEHGRWMAERIPNARLLVLRGAGHMPFYQQPKEFNRAVLSFLSEESTPNREETHAQQP